MMIKLGSVKTHFLLICLCFFPGLQGIHMFRKRYFIVQPPSQELQSYQLFSWAGRALCTPQVSSAQPWCWPMS